MDSASLPTVTPKGSAVDPSAIPSKEEEHLLISSPPLIDSNPSPKSAASKLTFICLVVVTSISVLLALVFAYLFATSSPSHFQRNSSSPSASCIPSNNATVGVSATSNMSYEVARPLSKLKKPIVLLVSSDGFRFGYQFKTETPNIHRLISNGTEAERGLIPVFPTLTFPNHYSIVTGLYPAYHGIINNYFTDPVSGDKFTMASHEPKWWLGEPLWETVVNHGLKAATYFWPGSEVHKGSWVCPVNYCRNYNGAVPFEERVDTVLKYFDLPSDDIPSFITLYFEDPDHQGHEVGPDDPLITEAVARIDEMLGRLIRGLEQRGVFEDISIILLGDHGMVGTCDKKLIFLGELSNWIHIPPEWVQSYTPLLAIKPDSSVSAKDVVEKMNQGLLSGKVKNGDKLRVYLKEDLPQRLHYADSYRIPSIIGLIEEGFKVEQKRSRSQECGGAHGYDNRFFSMRTIFIAHGPQFGKGRKVPSFENVEIYNLITKILNVQGAANNGTASFSDNVLLPSA